MKSRVELALENSIRDMFKYESKYSLSDMCEKLPSKIHISLMNGSHEAQEGDPIGCVRNVLRKKGILYHIDHPTPDEYKNPVSCKIHLVQAPFILGREFDNLIYFSCPSFDVFYLNQFSNDLNNLMLLRNVSRAKCNLHIITPGEKETNRLRLKYLSEQNNSYINYDDSKAVYDPEDQWRIYLFSVINRFVFINLLRDGALTLLPLPNQDFNIAMDLLKGGCLIEKLKCIKDTGANIIAGPSKTKFEDAFKVYAKGIILIHRRLIGDYTWLRFDPLYDMVECTEVSRYMNEVKIYLNKLLINCGICLMSMGDENTGNAMVIFQFAKEDDTQGAENCWFQLAKIFYNFPDYPACINALRKCLELNHGKQNALKLLGKANRMISKSEKNSDSMYLSGIYEKRYNDMKEKFRKIVEHAISNDPENFIVHKKENFIMSNCRLQIMNSILKQLSGFKKREWKLEHECGLEYEDMYNT